MLSQCGLGKYAQNQGAAVRSDSRYRTLSQAAIFGGARNMKPLKQKRGVCTWGLLSSRSVICRSRVFAGHYRSCLHHAPSLVAFCCHKSQYMGQARGGGGGGGLRSGCLLECTCYPVHDQYLDYCTLGVCAMLRVDRVWGCTGNAGPIFSCLKCFRW